MRSRFEIYAVCLFGVIVYLTFILLVFNGLADINKVVKQSIFKFYGVPLKD